MQPPSFICGLPESGHYLLVCALGQNPSLKLNLNSRMFEAVNACLNPVTTQGKEEHTLGLVRNVVQAFGQGPETIEVGCGWAHPQSITTLAKAFGQKPKIVATLRSIPDCVANKFRLSGESDLTQYCETSQAIAAVKTAYQLIRAGYAEHSECFLFVNYDDLVEDLHRELARVHEFLGLAPFKYELANFEPSLRNSIDARAVLKHHYASFCQPEFWTDKPKAKPEIDKLDLQLAASTSGNFEEGRRLADELARDRPNCSRAAFNRGWYELREGKILKGYELMNRGRKVGVFGDSPPRTNKPLWSGQSCTLLLQLEGGLGDQIHQIRYAQNFFERGCDVIVSCSESLIPLFKGIHYISAFVKHGQEDAVYHDYWTPGMSAPLALGLELEDLSGKSYLLRPYVPKGKFRIGLRWSGNKLFEREHHKLFPFAPFFDAVKCDNVEFISLQRDADTEAKPDWVQTVPLGTWDETQQAIASCNLVISSCTSVSHLAAAMGIATWVVLPVMPYFLYALPGERTPYYDSMRLFRQKVFGDWTHPMSELRQEIAKLSP